MLLFLKSLLDKSANMKVSQYDFFLKFCTPSFPLLKSGCTCKHCLIDNSVVK